MTKRTGIMLPYQYSLARLSRFEPPYIVQPKLNGDRCRAVRTEKPYRYILYSSQGKVKDFGVPHIVCRLAGLLLRHHDYIELDGELYVHNVSHQKIRSIVSRTANLHPLYTQVEYHIYDIIVDNVCQWYRANMLHALERSITEPWPIKIVPTYRVKDVSQLNILFESFLRRGYEGIIVRNKDAYYQRKRTTDLLKLKPRLEDTFKIVGATEEMSIHGERKHSLGAVVCTTRARRPERFSVGTGPVLTLEGRRSLWTTRSNLMGAIARVKYQELSERGVPIFPVLVGIE